MSDEYNLDKAERGRLQRPGVSLGPRIGEDVDGRDKPGHDESERGHDEGRGGDLRDQIEQLEERIEALAARAEQCRKIIVFGKATIAVGVVVLLAIVTGVIPFSPVAMICGMAAALGGIVAVGSNGSTLDQTRAAIASAEAERKALIGQIGLRLVEG